MLAIVESALGAKPATPPRIAPANLALRQSALAN
jgi:hypothetical protein